jgi:hypothetical protein
VLKFSTRAGGFGGAPSGPLWSAATGLKAPPIDTFTNRKTRNRRVFECVPDHAQVVQPLVVVARSGSERSASQRSDRENCQTPGRERRALRAPSAEHDAGQPESEGREPDRHADRREEAPDLQVGDHNPEPDPQVGEQKAGARLLGEQREHSAPAEIAAAGKDARDREPRHEHVERSQDGVDGACHARSVAASHSFGMPDPNEAP